MHRHFKAARKSYIWYHHYAYVLVAMQQFHYVFLAVWLRVHPVNQPEKIDQSDSFLPTKVLACKTVFYCKSWRNNWEKNVTKADSKLETSCPNFPSTLYQIEAESWCKILG